MAFSGRIRRELKTTEVPIDDASSAADRVLSAQYVKGQLAAIDTQLAEIASNKWFEGVNIYAKDTPILRQKKLLRQELLWIML